MFLLGNTFSTNKQQQQQQQSSGSARNSQSPNNYSNYHNVNSQSKNSFGILTTSNTASAINTGPAPPPPSTSTNTSTITNTANTGSPSSSSPPPPNVSTNKNMLSNFVGGISNISHSNQSYLKSQPAQVTSSSSNNDNNTPSSAVGSLFYFSSSYGNTAIAPNNTNSPVSGSGALAGSSFNPKNDYVSSGQNLNPQQLQQLRMYKRRSITSSPVRYNFNSKSSPPVTMRIIDTANLMQQQVQQSIENTNNINSVNIDARNVLFSNSNQRYF